MFVDEKDNLINNDDTEATSEEYLDEFGNKKFRQVSVIKEEIFKEMDELMNYKSSNSPCSSIS